MDIWKYYGITHRDHLICNPTSEAKLDELVGLLRLPDDARVLDVACGKAELLCRIAARHGGTGVGVDISPYEVEAARARVASRGLSDRLEIVAEDGAKYEVPEASLDLALCIGASWVWGGHRGTLQALGRRTRPGGLVAVGEPFKLRDPAPEEVAQDPELLPTLVSHHENVATAVELGLTPLYTIVSSPDDWDRYEGLQWRAAETWALEHPDDPDVPELLSRVRKGRDAYLRRGRDTIGWAIYLFRTP